MATPAPYILYEYRTYVYDTTAAAVHGTPAPYIFYYCCSILLIILYIRRGKSGVSASKVRYMHIYLYL